MLFPVSNQGYDIIKEIRRSFGIHPRIVHQRVNTEHPTNVIRLECIHWNDFVAVNIRV